MMSPIKHLSWSCLALVLCIVLFEITSLDLWFQQFLYNAETQRWLVDKNNMLLDIVFYSGIKKLLGFAAILMLGALFFLRKKDIVKQYRSGLLVVLLSLIIVPSLVGALKASTNMACPKSLMEFGGQITHISLLSRYSDELKPAAKQRCFPAAHASGGFALMSLFYLFKTSRRRQQGLAFGFALGWLMGGYKMLIGDHFLSHTLVTMILSWLVINLLVLVGRTFSKKHKAKAVLLETSA